ncbi:RNA polymerase factor sigma-54 [Lysobacter pythonis]|uniref:RNA polymerase sigma-54 factor n=1 Tax=Solilutibacter pythonis TaxID=2483112 RepID=A0A3M2I166_9GAMM|nr:RNA polymerase factor sigma-54 [Lysobacter pythonis]RMH94115.1 RNA polymerase factor sigma-54 [Lysobacter pythonis]
MKQQLTASQTQQLALTPQLRQALAVLQMSAIELETEIAEAIETNPLLEWSDDSPPAEASDGNAEYKEEAPEWERLEAGEDWSTPGDWQNGEEWRRGNGGSDDIVERQAAEEDLRQHLLWQLCLSHLGPRDLQIGSALIDAIDDDGYLREPLQGIIELLRPRWEIDESDILPVLHLIQRFDPLASGSRDLGECLCIQLSQLPENTPALPLARRIAAEAIMRLPKIGPEGVAREFHCAPREATTAIELLRTLDPRPGAQIGGLAQDTYVTPDAVIWRQKGLWRAALAAPSRPRICINHEYARMAAKAAGSDGRYLRGRLQEARWLLKNIEQRGETLLRVLNCLIREQAGFLEFGENALRPLTLREVAAKLELHESTISRAIARKHVHTPRGTLALRDFFASGIDNDGVSASSTAIQSMIRELIDAENPRKPLSDAALVVKLKERGVPVARRTVAKYREVLGIASSHERVRL